MIMSDTSDTQKKTYLNDKINIILSAHKICGADIFVGSSFIYEVNSFIIRRTSCAAVGLTMLEMD